MIAFRSEKVLSVYRCKGRAQSLSENPKPVDRCPQLWVPAAKENLR